MKLYARLLSHCVTAFLLFYHLHHRITITTIIIIITTTTNTIFYLLHSVLSHFSQTRLPLEPGSSQSVLTLFLPAILVDGNCH